MSTDFIADKTLLYCYNCYNTNHIAKNCPYTVLSYGIVCYKMTKDEPSYLMVERRHSFAFVEFLMGRYNILDSDYIQKMFNRMTLFERCLICSHYSFKFLWFKLWEGYKSQKKEYKKSIQKEFCRGSIKFYILKNGFRSITDNRFHKLDDMVKNCKSNYKRPEWFFPKGKKSDRNEHNLDCALREFEEETDIPKHCVHVIPHDDQQFEEQHVGFNNKTYKVNFYIAKLQGDDVTLDYVPKSTEIGDIGWFNYSDCLKHFRNYETEKYQLLKKIHKFVVSFERKNKKHTTRPD